MLKYANNVFGFICVVILLMSFLGQDSNTNLVRNIVSTVSAIALICIIYMNSYSIKIRHWFWLSLISTGSLYEFLHGIWWFYPLDPRVALSFLCFFILSGANLSIFIVSHLKNKAAD